MKRSIREDKIPIKAATTTMAAILTVTLGLVPITITNHTVSAAPGDIQRGSGAGLSKTIVEDDIETGILLSVDESKDKLFLSLGQLNISTFESIISITEFVSIDEDDFSMTGNLDSASLDTTITVFDEVSQEEMEIAIKASWTGVGKLENSVYQVHDPKYVHPAFQFDEHSHITIHGLCRTATASVNLSGDITLNMEVSLPQSEDDTQLAVICKSFLIGKTIENPK